MTTYNQRREYTQTGHYMFIMAVVSVLTAFACLLLGSVKFIIHGKAQNVMPHTAGVILAVLAGLMAVACLVACFRSHAKARR